ncbi:MAG: hypothetical protein JXA72_07320 [Bacteroidales bacterium]|nr:hypothetical protein [Bacteroidales bacterium]
MVRKLAIPVKRGKLTAYMEECHHYEIFEIADGNVRSEEIVTIPKKSPDQLPEWAKNKGITDIIIYKASKRTIHLFAPYGINLFVGVPISTSRRLVEEYIHGQLKSDEKIIYSIMIQHEQ